MVYNGVGFGLREVLSPTLCGGSPSGPGPSVASRHLPTPWGVTLAEGAKGLASLCETDSPDTGEVAVRPEGERWPRRAGGREPCGCPKHFLFTFYAAGWLSVSVESVSVLSLSAVDSDAMMSVTWLEPSRFSFFCASSASAIRPPICWMFGSVAV